MADISLDETGNWYDGVAGDNTDRAEALSKFDSADAFFESHNALAEAGDKDWRTEMAGDDDKFKSQLERYSTPTDFGNAFREQRATISAGNLLKPLAEDASDEDIKAFREAQGIPLESSGYMENLPEGLVLGEDDKEIFADFASSLHDANAPPEIAHKALEWYNGFAQQTQDAEAAMDASQREETTEQLRSDWGTDYQANMNLVTAFLENTFGAEAKAQILDGRYKDGRAFLNDTKILQGLADAQRRLDPITQIIKGGGDPQQTLNDEISEIEKLMRDDRPAYNKDEAKQARLRELYDIRSAHKAA